MTQDDDARRLAEIYSAHAQGYAEGWSPVIRPVGRRLLGALDWHGVRRVLDVGAGAGGHFGDIRDAVPGAWLLGVDRSPGMLEVARTQAVPLAVMDAVALGIRSGSIDVAVMAFVLFHVAEPVGGLTEVRRVLRPGGTLAVTTWADDPEVEASRVWEAELDAWGAVDPTPMPARRDELMNTPAKLAALFSAAGLQAIRVWTEPIEHAWDADALFALRVAFGRTKRKLESLPSERQVAFLKGIRDRWSRLDRDAFVYRAAVVCGVARR